MKPGRSLFNIIFALLGACLVVFLLLPLASTIFASSSDRLVQTLLHPQVMRSIELTFRASALATGIALLAGVPLAYLLARHRFWGKQLVEGIIDLPVIVPHTAAGVALLLVFGAKGIIGRPLGQLGIYFTDRLAGIVVAMLFVSLPYLVNMSREAFALIDPELEKNALVEGASPWQAFRFVSLPLAWRGVLSGALMMWARGISEFGAVVILAYNPKIAPVLIYELFSGFGLSTALPVAALLILAALVVFTLLRWLARAE